MIFSHIFSSARGNTTLESAVTLTKALRWDIQALGVRLDKAASAEELSRKSNNRAKSKAAHEVELRQIILDIRKLLDRIEDAVPLINLAITTSGARLSTTLPASISPSRLLQASTFLTAGDTQYSMSPASPVQVGPAFILSLYMLFSGHAHRFREGPDGGREATWKEVIHKSRLRIMRVPIETQESVLQSVESDVDGAAMMAGDGRANEFNYHLEIIEDFDDDRVHAFEDNELQPGPYEGIALAGIRELVPIHQVSKIFYADTGKILNIGNPGETNNPVLLLKRDVNALPPRRMMRESEQGEEFLYDEAQDLVGIGRSEQADDGDSQDDIDQQLRRESSVLLSSGGNSNSTPLEFSSKDDWRLPPDLDPEWLALEVYTESEEASDDEEFENAENDDSSYGSRRQSPAIKSPTTDITNKISNLDLKSTPPSTTNHMSQKTPSFSTSLRAQAPSFGPIRSSLSLLEMLVRLTSLQQFQQASHLSIPDELLTFFLEESSTTGAGGDGDERRRTRREARAKVGFDPYDESPIKRRGEDYQYQYQDEGYSRSGTPYSSGGTPYNEPSPQDQYPPISPAWQRQTHKEGSDENWLRSRESPGPGRSGSSVMPSSPLTPYKSIAKKGRPLDRVQRDGGAGVASPLGRGASVETDSSLGTSPGSPVHGHKGKD
jgi:hypothetical protein